jgi:DNA-binding NtrC family response regulator
MERYSWPGNVRQLQNVIQRAIILSDDNRILPEHIILDEDESPEQFEGTLKDFEKLLLRKRLEKFGGNRTLTAQSLGVSVRWVQLKLKEMEGESEA